MEGCCISGERCCASQVQIMWRNHPNQSSHLPCPSFQISNRVLYVFFTHVQEFFGNVTLKQVTKPLRWSNMATMPALPETQESIKEEIRRQVGEYFSCLVWFCPGFNKFSSKLSEECNCVTIVLLWDATCFEKQNSTYLSWCQCCIFSPALIHWQ